MKPRSLRERKSVVVMAGDGRTSDRGARALAEALSDAGIAILYLGRAQSAREIAHAAAEAKADAIEVCLAGAGGVALIRELLKELSGLDGRQVSLVVHRVQ